MMTTMTMRTTTTITATMITRTPVVCVALLGGLLHTHSHANSRTDRALESSERGIWALKISLVGLLATAIFQVVIVADQWQRGAIGRHDP